GYDQQHISNAQGYRRWNWNWNAEEYIRIYSSYGLYRSGYRSNFGYLSILAKTFCKRCNDRFYKRINIKASYLQMKGACFYFIHFLYFAPPPMPLLSEIY